MKTLATLILAFIVSTCDAQVDTIKVNYFEILNIDSTVYQPEWFFTTLREHYSPLGEIEEISCIIGDRYYDVEKICIRFKNNPYRWFVYTPKEAENKLAIALNKNK